MNISWEECAKILMISRTTLWRCATELGIATGYSQLSANELDAVVRKIKHESPNSGIIMVWGQLRGYGIKAREKVRQSLDRISPSAITMRRTRTISRRVYSVPSSNALWHIDGLHCLIRWRIVVLHGGIDGYSRQVVLLQASSNNRATTVLELLLTATRKYGWLSRVRSDLGGENVDVASVQIAARGTGRGSHIAGSSVHNQRIERLWRDTFHCVCHLPRWKLLVYYAQSVKWTISVCIMPG